MASGESSQADLQAAFFPVELRPVGGNGPIGQQQFQKLSRSRAVVDTESGRAFTAVTDDYRLITNREAYKLAKQTMKKALMIESLESSIRPSFWKVKLYPKGEAASVDKFLEAS